MSGIHNFFSGLHPLLYSTVLSVITLIGARIAVRLAERAMETAFAKIPKLDGTVFPLCRTVTKYGIYATAALFILNSFGVDTTGVFALLGAAGIAVGLALKDTLSNIAAGLILLILRPFKNGDYIETPSVGGKIREINLFVTLLETSDGVDITVPNGVLWGAPVKNYSHNPLRRLSIVIGISYGDSIDTAFEVLQKIIAADARFLKNPEPQIFLKTLADSSVNIEMRAWVKNEDFWQTQWDTNKTIKTEIEKAGLTFPFPQNDVHIFQK